MSKKEGPLCYSFANFLILSRIKQAIGLDQAKMFLYGAAPMKQSTSDYFASLNMPIFNYYGMSETTATGVAMRPGRFSMTTSGYVPPGQEILIQNPDKKGEGEICMKGRHIMMGYLKNEKATRETLDPQGYLHSGDLGIITDLGFLKITGRIKELIITAGGENVAPVPIEDNFKDAAPYVSNVMIIGDDRKFLSALVTFKVEVDPSNQRPTVNLTPEAMNYFKKNFDLDIKTSDEAAKSDVLLKDIKRAFDVANKKSVSRAA